LHYLAQRHEAVSGGLPVQDPLILNLSTR